MLYKVKNTIEKFNMLEKGDTVVIGVSGGADSVCLAHVMNCIKEEYDLHIILVHVNHQLRGADADRDEAYVMSLGEKYDCDVRIFSYDVAKLAKERGLTLEETGRELRYEAFYKTAGERGKIAVAHNINDNCETMLMRFFRGTGIKGLGGINPIRDNIIRPLIEISRAEIEGYCLENKLEYYTDYTNNIDIYTRNKIRLKLIPFIEKELNPNIVNTLYRTSEIMAAEDKYLSEAAQKAYNECEVSPKRIDVERLKAYDPVIQRRIIRLGFVDFSADLHDISYSNVENVLSLAEKESGRTIELPHGLRAVREQSTIYFCRSEERKPFFYEINKDEKKYCKELGAYILLTDKKCEKNAKLLYTISFDYDKIKLPLALRSRKAGDKIYIAGIGGSKSLKKLFIDSKVPMVERDGIPILAMGSDVLWISDMKTSDRYKAGDTTVNYLHMYLLEE